MKKLLSTLTAAVMTAAAAVPFISSAEDTPEFYLKLRENSPVYVDIDGTVIVDRAAVGDGLTLTCDTFIKDDSLTCWYVAPKIKSSSKSVKLANPVDPVPDDAAEYSAYAYAETDGDGKIIRDRHETILTLNENLNIINFTCQKQRTLADSSPLTPYGEKTDDYPLLSFDIQLTSGIESGEYSVYFLTEHEDDPDQRITQVAMRVNGSTVITPEVKNMKLVVVDAPLGDVNNDGFVNAADASDVLVAYSKLSTGFPSDLTPVQTISADVNRDRMINSSDASSILVYYAYASTTSGNVLTLEEFLYS